MANVFEPEFDAGAETPGATYRRARVGRQAGAERLGASVYELPPGQVSFPYHWHSANEEMLVVLRGRPSLRTPGGWRELHEGEVVAFPIGSDGAHQVANRTPEAVRVMVVSEMNSPELSGYPDSGKLLAADRAPGAPASAGSHFRFFRIADEVDYWDGEEPPDLDAVDQA